MSFEEKNKAYLEQIEQIRSKEYREAVELCLEEAEASGELSFIDIICLNPKHRQEEDWDYFDHVYVDQQTNGGYTGDSFAGYIWIPITKKLYLKSYYSI